MATELDCLSVIESKPGSIESVDPLFIQEKLKQAQSKSWEVLNKIRSQLSEGLTEDEARKLALKVFQDHGVSKHWHKPYIRFGVGTKLTFHDPLQDNYRLQMGDPVSIDLGPVWPDAETGLSYEGDVGDTFSFGASNPEVENFAQTVRDLFKEAKSEWHSKKLTGQEIYEFLGKRAQSMGYKLVAEVAGHRVGDFPHQKYTKERLSRVQFQPKSNIWVLEIQLIHPGLNIGAFFEDILND